MKNNKIKTIDVNAKEWFDRVNGNSYFAGIVTVNFGMPTEKSFNMPFQYGYGDSYKDAALRELQKNSLLTDINHLWQMRDKGIILRANKIEGCKKRELNEY